MDFDGELAFRLEFEIDDYSLAKLLDFDADLCSDFTEFSPREEFF